MDIKQIIPEEDIRKNFPIIYECTPADYENIADRFLSKYPPVNRDEAVAWIKSICLQRFLETDEDLW